MNIKGKNIWSYQEWKKLQNQRDGLVLSMAVADLLFWSDPVPFVLWTKGYCKWTEVPNTIDFNKATKEGHFPRSSRSTAILLAVGMVKFPSPGTVKSWWQSSWNGPLCARVKIWSLKSSTQQISVTATALWEPTARTFKPFPSGHHHRMFFWFHDNSKKNFHLETHQCFNLSNIRNNKFSFHLEDKYQRSQIPSSILLGLYCKTPVSCCPFRCSFPTSP